MKHHPLPEGTRVKFHHLRMVRSEVNGDVDYINKYQFRNGDHSLEGNVSLLQFGGETRCEIILPDGTEFRGYADCHPKKDKYNKKIGRDIAFGRAYKRYLEDAKA